MAAGRDVIELNRDAHALAGLAYAAFDDIADAEFLADLLQVDGPALVGERRVARDDEEPAQLRERRDEVLAEAVGKIFLLCIAAHVDEGEHGDHRPVGPWRRRKRRICGNWARAGLVAGGARLYLSDEPDALARKTAYQGLFLAPVSDRPSHCLDVRGERRVGHDPAAPQRG